MNYFLLLAGGVSAFGLVIHVMVGRKRQLRDPADPLGAVSALNADAWFGRHIQTVLLAAMAIVFADSARNDGARDVAVWLALIALAAAGLRLLTAVQTAAPNFDVRSWGAFAAAGILALVGLAV